MSAYLRCRPGDLAVIVNCVNPENLGLIVRVIGRWLPNHDDWAPAANLCEWEIEATSQRIMTMNLLGEKLFWKRCPAPDSGLQPIRGDRVDDTQDHAIDLEQTA